MRLAVDVMAVTGPTSSDQNAVRTVQKCLDDIFGVHHAAAHHADDFNIRRIGHPGRTGQIGCGKRAPIAEKGDDFRFKLTHWVPPVLIWEWSKWSIFKNFLKRAAGLPAEQFLYNETCLNYSK